MIDIKLAFNHYDISTMGLGRAIRDVTQRIELEEKANSESLVRVPEAQQCEKAAAIVHDLLGVNMKFDNHHRAVLTTQAIVQSIVKNDFKVDNVEEVVSQATQYAERFISNPDHQYFFATKESTAESTVEVAVVEGIDVKVAVKADGKIKKGGKEVLADALYKKYVAELNGAPYENQAFISILVKELGMSKAGATTYNYNMKKKHGGQIEAKPKRAK